ncbi:MAG: O-antigen ligase family protein, partial [Candidatus Eisenbacteria bacterium]|nr:O-antigen ligase family protein [Candidatus Eisenbacteria bacterium]
MTAQTPSVATSDVGAAAMPAAAPATPLAALAAAGFVLFAATLPIGLAPMTIAGVLCVTLAIVAALAGVTDARRMLWARTPVAVPALAWIAATLIATALAADPRASAASLGRGALPLVAGFAAAQASDRARGGRAIVALLAAGSMAALIGVARFVAAGARFPSRAIGLSGSWMTFGVAMMLLASVAAAIALTARDRAWRLGASCAAFAALVALAASFTRAAWIGAALALAIVFALARPRWLIALAALIVLVFAAPGDFGARLRSAIDPAHPLNREREMMWQAGRRILAEHPWFGVGLVNLQPWIEPY